MSDTALAAGAALVFLAGAAFGVWARGVFILTQDTIRRELAKERSTRRGCEERQRELIDQLRKQNAEIQRQSERLALLTAVVSGNLPTDFLGRDVR